MDLKRLTRWLTLGANLGAFVGIVLLVAELRQTSEITRAQIRNDITQEELSLLSLTAGNLELNDVLVRADRDQELSDAEQYMYESRSEAVFRLWQNVHYQGRKGMYDEEEFAKHIETMGLVLSQTPGLVKYWCNARVVYPEVFAAEIDGLLPDHACVH